MLLNFSKIDSKYIECYGVCLSHYTLTNEVRVIKGKIIKKMTSRE